MASTGTSDEVAQLAELIEMYNDAYQTGEALVSDEEFDSLVEHLRELDPSHPLVTQAYHHQYQATDGSSPEVTLPVYVGSLDKVKPDTSALRRFLDKAAGEPVVLSEKLDGVSIMLVVSEHESGYQFQALTRGRGFTGHDVSQHLVPYLNLTEIGQQIKGSTGLLTNPLLIRGELILPRSAGDTLETEKNLRSIVSGTVNAKNPKVSVLEQVRFVAYGLPQADSLHISPMDQIGILESWGFSVPLYTRLDNTGEEQLTTDLLKYYLSHWKDTSAYEIDGVVIAIDRPEPIVPGKNPKNSVAFKMPLGQQKAVTTVQEVVWKPSKGQRLKPTIRVAPVKIGGVQIVWVTGNNGRFIVENGIGPGATVEVIRSGDVIPKIHRVIHPVPPEDLQLPTVSYTWNESKAEMVATEVSQQQQVSVLLSFVRTLRVKYLSEATARNLVESGVIYPEQLLNQTVAQLSTLPKMGETSATRIFDNLHQAMSQATPEQLMAASNCFPNIGQVRLEAITNHFRDTLRDFGQEVDYRTVPEILSVGDIIDIPGFQVKTAEVVIASLARFHQFCEDSPLFSAYFQDSLDRYYHQLQTASTDPQPVAETPWTGIKVTFTGFRDATLAQQLQSLGATMKDTFSASSTGLLVKKDGASSNKKEETAHQRGIPVLTRSELVKQITPYL